MDEEDKSSLRQCLQKVFEMVRMNMQLERMIQDIQSYDRARCKALLRSLPRLRLDFTDEYLDGLSLDRLRHIVFAACMQSCKVQV